MSYIVRIQHSNASEPKWNTKVLRGREEVCSKRPLRWTRGEQQRECNGLVEPHWPWHHCFHEFAKDMHQNGAVSRGHRKDRGDNSFKRLAVTGTRKMCLQVKGVRAQRDFMIR